MLNGSFNHYDLRDAAPAGALQYVNQTSSRWEDSNASPRQALMHNMIFHVPGYPVTFQGKVKGVIAKPSGGKWYYMNNSKPPLDPIPFTAS